MSNQIEKVIISNIKDSNFYDALQSIMALLERQYKSKNINKILLALQQYAQLMIDYKEHDCAIEIGEKVLGYLKLLNTDITLEIIEIFISILNQCSNVKCARKYIFCNEIIFSSKSLPNLSEKEQKYGQIGLHKTIASYLILDKEYGTALMHLILCDDPELIYELLCKWSKACYPSEMPLIIHKTVLIILASKNVGFAEYILNKYSSSFDDKFPNVYLQATFLITACVKHSDQQYWKLVRTKYKLQNVVDNELETILNQIGSLYFNENNNSNMLENMFSGLMGQLKI